MAYAEGTTVAFEKSIAEIITLLRCSGAERIGQMDDPNRFTLGFTLADRVIRFHVAIPTADEVKRVDRYGCALPAAKIAANVEQARRQRGRALLLVIKAKLESVESKVETFEEAFLANVVMSDGMTVYERISAPIALEYQTGKPTMMLEGPPSPAPALRQGGGDG